VTLLGRPTLWVDSKVEFQRQLDNPGIVACRDDATKAARADYLPGCGVDAGGIQVADRICEIWMIEQVEEFGAKFQGLGLGDWE